jgi:hypothetical protein
MGMVGTNRETASEVAMLTTEDTLVILAELSTDMEASMIIAALEREGIEAFMKGQFTAGWRADAPSWPKVEVRESDYARARAILDSFEASCNTVSEDDSKISTWKFICKLLIVVILVYYALVFLSDILAILTGSL